MNKTLKMMIGWSILSSSVMFIFWLIWYMINGSVPIIESIKMTPDWTYNLPFCISRWWDCLLIIPYACIIVMISRDLEIDYLIIGLIFGSIIVSIFGLIIGSQLSLGFVSIFGLIIGLIVGLIVGLIFELEVGLEVGLDFILGVGLGAGLIFGLGAGLIFGLGAGLIFGLIYLLKINTIQDIIDNWLLDR